MEEPTSPAAIRRPSLARVPQKPRRLPARFVLYAGFGGLLAFILAAAFGTLVLFDRVRTDDTQTRRRPSSNGWARSNRSERRSISPAPTCATFCCRPTPAARRRSAPVSPASERDRGRCSIVMRTPSIPRSAMPSRRCGTRSTPTGASAGHVRLDAAGAR